MHYIRLICDHVIRRKCYLLPGSRGRLYRIWRARGRGGGGGGGGGGAVVASGRGRVRLPRAYHYTDISMHTSIDYIIFPNIIIIIIVNTPHKVQYKVY